MVATPENSLFGFSGGKNFVNGTLCYEIIKQYKLDERVQAL